MNPKIRVLFSMIPLLMINLFFSCSSNSERDEAEINRADDDHSDASDHQICDGTSDFPNLGPGSPQSCDDVSNPNNKGTLDFRTDASVGGYSNALGDWGSYKITGVTVRYNGTKTRVERFFKTISRGINTKTVLTGSLRIRDLSDGNTCIIQSHAGGDILQGEEAGSTNRSAQFLLYAKKTSDGAIMIETHVTVNPYTTNTEGSREVKDFKTLNFDQEYTFTYETGYDASGVSFSKIAVGSSEKYITHNHTTERVYTRYGAYGTGDTGDVTAHVEFKEVNLCRE